MTMVNSGLKGLNPRVKNECKAPEILDPPCATQLQAREYYKSLAWCYQVSMTRSQNVVLILGPHGSQEMSPSHTE